MLHGMRASIPGLVIVALAALGGCDALTGAANKVNPFASFETRCARLPASRVEVVQGEVTPTQDHSLSHRSLTQLAQDDPDAHRTYGLTRATFSENAQLDIRGLRDASTKRSCARPQVRVELGMGPMTVYVARELEGDACRVAAVTEHEMKHVAVYRDHLRAAAADLADRLPELYGQRVFVAGDSAQTEAQMRGMLQEFMGAFMRESTRRLKARQDEVDSAEEYDHVGRACGGMAVAE